MFSSVLEDYVFYLSYVSVQSQSLREITSQDIILLYIFDDFMKQFSVEKNKKNTKWRVTFLHLLAMYSIFEQSIKNI